METQHAIHHGQDGHDGEAQIEVVELGPTHEFSRCLNPLKTDALRLRQRVQA